MRTREGEPRRYQGPVLNPLFERRFRFGPVLSLPLSTGKFKGRLFLVDKVDMSSDDLVFGEIIYREVEERLEEFELIAELRRSAALEGRIQLARDLHDGLLQSLAAASVEIESAARLVRPDPDLAGERLAGVQQTLLQEQRDLRRLVEQLRAGTGPPPPRLDLEGRLAELEERLERHWGLEVEVEIEQRSLPAGQQTSLDLYFLIREGLANVVRHAQATKAAVRLSGSDGRITLTLSDNGRGFPFHGRHDLEELDRLGVGPVGLKQRVRALRGNLLLESTTGGTRIDIELPVFSGPDGPSL